MDLRTLGRTGMRVSPLCLGAMMFGAWGNPDHDDCVRIVHAALDAGVNFIDTADVYSGGESEEIVAKSLAGGRRDGVILATKVHAPMGADPNMAGNSRRWITREVESSLRAAAHRLDRPLPDPPARPHLRHRRHPGRPVGPRPPGQGAGHRLLDVPGRPDRGGPLGGRAPRTRALRVRTASVLDPGPRGGGCRLAGLSALRDGRHRVEPAQRRLAHRALPQGRPPARRGQGQPRARPVLPVAPGGGRQARGRRVPRRGGRRRRRAPHPSGPGLRPHPSRRDVGHHRPPHHGADDRHPGSPRRRPSPTRSSTGSTPSSLPGTTVDPSDAGWTPPLDRRRLARGADPRRGAGPARTERARAHRRRRRTMPDTPTMSIEEATQAITAPGQMFEMEEVEIRGIPTRVWKNCPANLRVVLELSRGHGDADYLVYEDERTTFEEHFRIAAAIARELRGPLRRRTRRPRRHRHAQPARVGHGLLGRGRGRWRGGAAQRLVDEPRAPLRTGRLGDQGRLRRRGPSRAPGAAPRRAPRPSGRGGHPRGPHRGTRHARCAPFPSSPSRSWWANRRPTSPCPTSPSSPRTTPPSSTRRARRGGPRVRWARTATWAPT